MLYFSLYLYIVKIRLISKEAIELESFIHEAIEINILLNFLVLHVQSRGIMFRVGDLRIYTN